MDYFNGLFTAIGLRIFHRNRKGGKENINTPNLPGSESSEESDPRLR